jgi:hypothetical protein
MLQHQSDLALKLLDSIPPGYLLPNPSSNHLFFFPLFSLGYRFLMLVEQPPLSSMFLLNCYLRR